MQVEIICRMLSYNAGVATERARFMELVREQIQNLQETHGTAAPALTFTGGALQAVRPEETAQAVSTQLLQHIMQSLV